MQNKFATPNPLALKFKNVLSGLQVYVTSSPQRTRNDKRDETPERKDAQLEDARRCAYASVGLDTDAKRANGMIGWGFIGTAWATAETIVNRTIPLGPQETAELARYTRCLDAALAEGRKSYYDSFSTDLTEVQAFTSNILKEIEGILETGVKMNTKPLECPN